jgi:hypothetical protein
MDDISQKLSKESAAKLIFIIFSNANVAFAESDSLLISKEPWYIDHLIMSKCDYLICPPSTFPLWAYYMGKNDIFIIKNSDGAWEKNTGRIPV